MAAALLLGSGLDYLLTTSADSVKQSDAVPSINSAGAVSLVPYGGSCTVVTTANPMNEHPAVPESTSNMTPAMVTTNDDMVNQPPNVFSCNSLDHWRSPEADNHQGLRLARSIDPVQWQGVADKIAKQKQRDPDDIICKKTINLAAPEAKLKQRIDAAASALSASCGIPQDLADLIYQDAQALASILRKMMPRGDRMIMKLELFGANVCSRWHKDKFACRSLVSYNCSGTDYTDDSNVDFLEMEHGGSNEDIIRDKAQIYHANVGDILMIKGLTFPGKAKGLVHKSPEKKYHDNGELQTRIVLKVDIQEDDDVVTFA
jgi:hypothetical protein